MRGDGIISIIERLAPALGAGALLLSLLRHLGVPLPTRLLLRLGLAAAALMALAFGAQALDGGSAGTAVAGWLALGLPAYLVRRRIDGAPERAAEEGRLRQERGQERRRAQPQGGAGRAPAGNAGNTSSSGSNNNGHTNTGNGRSAP